MKYRYLAILGLISFASLAQEPSPAEMIRRGVENLTTQMSSQRSSLENDKQKLYNLVDREIGPHLAANKIARLVVGRHWHKADTRQKGAFVTAFRNLLIKTYAVSIFEHAATAKIEFKPFSKKTSNARTALVRTLVRFDDGTNMPIDYKFVRTAEGDWLIYDVIISRISLVVNFRNSYGRIIESDGFDALIELLQ